MSRIRPILSVIVAIIIFVCIAVIGFNGNIVWNDFWTGIAIFLVSSGIGVLVWGFKQNIHGLVKEQKAIVVQPKISTESVTAPETPKQAEPPIKQMTQLPLAFPEDSYVRNNLNNDFINKIYLQAYTQVIDRYSDAELTSLVITVNPFYGTSRIYVSFIFFSKFSKRECRFASSDFSDAQYTPPDNHIKEEPSVLSKLPWKESPQWYEALLKSYSKVKPLSEATGTYYGIRTYGFLKSKWIISFKDGKTGFAFEYDWDGKGLSDENIKERE